MWYAPRSNIILLAHISCTSQDLGYTGRYDGCGRLCPCRARLQVENTIVRKKNRQRCARKYHMCTSPGHIEGAPSSSDSFQGVPHFRRQL